MAPRTPTALESVVLTDASSTVFVAPARGGMVTRILDGDRDVLYLDEGTLTDATKNVRGGIPVLFPSPGRLEGDRFTYGGRGGAMGQHGFARNEAWDVVERSRDAVTLRLEANARTLALFPWDFTVTLTYALHGRSLAITQTVTTTEEAMPFAIGFHPYFAVPDGAKAEARVPTTATRAWDNVKKELIAPSLPLDLAVREIDLHLVDHPGDHAALELGDGHRIVLRGPYPRWVVWSLAGKDFVCLEPWTAPANALNIAGESRVVSRANPVTLVLTVEF